MKFLVVTPPSIYHSVIISLQRRHPLIAIMTYIMIPMSNPISEPSEVLPSRVLRSQNRKFSLLTDTILCLRPCSLLLWWSFRIPWTVSMSVLDLIPSFGYINRGKVLSVFNSHLCILHTFLGSFNNINSMDYSFLENCAYWLDSICVFLVLTDILNTLIFY